jgi:hypothetical protein
MEQEFESYLNLSDNLRRGYAASLLPVNENWNLLLSEVMEDRIPEFLKVIYSRVAGTRYEVKDQSLMDFIPGYLLIHVEEYSKAYSTLKKILKGFDIEETFYPILRNYSSDFYALKKETNEIYTIYHDDYEINLIHNAPIDFLNTLIANYEKEVYFLDDDGYLDYDMDMEYEVARQTNPGIEYWDEEE